MIAPRYILKVRVGRAEKIVFWDSSKEMQVGDRLPWKIRREKDSGKITLVHHDGKTLEYDSKIIDQNYRIQLKSPGQRPEETVTVKLVKVDKIRPAMVPAEALPSGVDPKQYHLQVFVEDSGTVVDVVEVGTSSYTGRTADGTDLFKVTPKSEDLFEVQLFNPDVQIVRSRTETETQNIRRGTGVTLRELHGIRIRLGSRDFYFIAVKDVSHVVDMDLHEKVTEVEQLRFARTTRNVFIGIFAAILLATFFLPEAKKEEEKLEFAKIVIKKREAVKPPETENAPASPSEDEGPKVAEPESTEVAKSPVVAPPKPQMTKTPPPAPLMPKIAEKKPEPPKPATPMIAPPKVVEKPKVAAAEPQKAPAPPAEPAKPKISQAVLNAMKLAGMTTQLSQGGSPIASDQGQVAAGRNDHRGALLGNGGSDAAKITNAGAASGQVDLSKVEGVQVSYTGGTGTGEGSYQGSRAGVGTGNKPGDFVAVQLGDAVPTFTAGGGLTRRQVLEVIQRHFDEIRYCYNVAITRRPNLEGRLVVNWIISGAGDVREPSVQTSSLPDKEIHECIVKRVGTWKFPAPKGNTDITVTYPFVFRQL